MKINFSAAREPIGEKYAHTHTQTHTTTPKVFRPILIHSLACIPIHSGFLFYIKEDLKTGYVIFHTSWLNKT